EGLVIDDTEAELTGKWAHGEGLKPYIGKHYSYGSDKGASARFAFSVKSSGSYDVRIFFQPHENRGRSVAVTVLSAEGETALKVDQTKAPTLPQGAYSLGTFKFTAGEEAAVIFRTANAGGNVHLDAVQVLPAK
ncbi:MAG TPA: NADH-dependent oxidoreductase, partial [Prosthecobacter sp.]